MQNHGNPRDRGESRGIAGNRGGSRGCPRRTEMAPKSFAGRSRGIAGDRGESRGIAGASRWRLGMAGAAGFGLFWPEPNFNENQSFWRKTQNVRSIPGNLLDGPNFLLSGIFRRVFCTVEPNCTRFETGPVSRSRAISGLQATHSAHSLAYCLRLLCVYIYIYVCM